jgi:prevent-host-death family protein
MEKRISAADANRQFSKMLQGVRKGSSFVITSHGEPVAKLIPSEPVSATMVAARADLIARLRREPVIRAGRWKRDELYEDTP